MECVHLCYICFTIVLLSRPLYDKQNYYTVLQASLIVLYLTDTTIQDPLNTWVGEVGTSIQAPELFRNRQRALQFDMCWPKLNDPQDNLLNKSLDEMLWYDANRQAFILDKVALTAI